MDNKILMAIGQRIRELRNTRGLTQELLAERCGFHFSYIGAVERAEKNISLMNIKKIADALGVSVQELFAYEFKGSSGNTERDKLLEEINAQLMTLKNKELRKVMIFLTEIIK